ncbi:MAG: hypothetical protein WCI06_03330, partial [Methylococcaceae bacterium]
VNALQAAPLTICQNGEWINKNAQPLQSAPLLDSETTTPLQAAPLTICQNGEWISQNGEWISQNGEPIPDINTDIKTDINKRTITTVNADFLSFDGLTAEQTECYEWAKHHDYWNFTAGNLHKFLKLFTNEKADGLKSQFDAHKKALQDDSGQTGHSHTLNKTKRTGNNYATNNTNNKSLTATQRRANLERIIGETGTTGTTGTNTNIDESNVVASYAFVVNAPLAGHG